MNTAASHPSRARAATAARRLAPILFLLLGVIGAGVFAAPSAFADGEGAVGVPAAAASATPADLATRVADLEAYITNGAPKALTSPGPGHNAWIDGMMNGVWNAKASIKAIDFAGGTVVHMSSGWSALILCLILGKRAGFGRRAFYPHSLVLTMIGTGMLWVGWYGFNAGSAVAADGIAAGAFMATTLATAVASVVWPGIEWVTRGKPTVLGFCSGAVAGLVVVTPASGFVTASGAVIIGVLAGAVPYVACTKLKSAFGYDDALDTFGVHGVGGTLGALVTGFLATADANPNLNTNLAGIVGKTLWIEQLKAMGLTVAMAVAGTTIIAMAVKAVLGLRPEAEGEEDGLDLLDHGEAGYHLDEPGHLASASEHGAAPASDGAESAILQAEK